MKVKDFLKYIKDNNISEDAEIMVERVEDVYFDEHNWTTEKQKSYLWYAMKEQIIKARTGVYDDKEKYPDMTDVLIENILSTDLDDFYREYVKTESVSEYPDSDKVYIHCHY